MKCTFNKHILIIVTLILNCAQEIKQCYVNIKSSQMASVSESIWQFRSRKRRRFDSWVGKIPWRRKWHPTRGFLPRRVHRQRSLVGCKESDMAELPNICKIRMNVQLISSVQFSSVAQSCPTLSNPMNRSTPGLPVHHQLPELAQTHAHQVGDAIQPSHPLSSPSPPAPNPSQHQGLFQ